MNSEKFEKKKDLNRKQRIEFIKLWADYVKSHDEVRSREQNGTRWIPK